MQLNKHPSPFNKGDLSSLDKKDSVPTRELWMARMSALRASVDMATAWVELVKFRKDLEAMPDVKAKQEEYYKDFIETITDDKEIPFW